MKRFRALSIFLSLTLAIQPAALTWASELPDLGESARTTFSALQEAQLGRQIMREIRGDKDFLADPEITEYLNALGERLAAANPDPSRQFQFFAVRDNTLNAFALPGGFIGVHSGLIAAARSESELAGVLAHEIAHVSQNHIARIVDAQKGNALVTLAALAVAILAARANSNLSQAAIAGAQAYSMQNQLDFTREHEREADRVGLQTLDNAGYSPSGMVTFFERLQQQSRHAESNAPAYLRTHPLTTERISDLQNRLNETGYRQHNDSAEFLLVRGKALALDGDAKEAAKRFEAAVRNRPDDAANLYALASSALRAGDAELAAATLARLQQRFNGPMIETLAARIELLNKRPDAALQRLKHAVARYSAAKPVAWLYAEVLIQQGQIETAAQFIDDRQLLWPEDAPLYALKAQVRHAQGKHAAGHLAEAESRIRTDQPSLAMEQLQLARKAGDGDFFTHSIIDARLRNLREQERDEVQERARKP